jgi:hypothetical protein
MADSIARKKYFYHIICLVAQALVCDATRLTAAAA